MISYQVEKFKDIYDELKELYPFHYKEVGVNQEYIPLDPDVDAYQSLENLGMLHIITIRDSGKLVGYHKAIVMNHLHFKSTKTAYTDLYYLLPEYRKGFTGVKLFKMWEECMRELGVKKLYSMTKLKKNNSPIFDRLNFERVEHIYTKYIGDK